MSYQNGGRGQCNSYRPISLTSVCRKALEPILKDNIMEHLESNKLIKDSQHGFRQGRSCVSDQSHSWEDSTKTINKGGCVDVIYIDFSLLIKCCTKNFT